MASQLSSVKLMRCFWFFLAFLLLFPECALGVKCFPWLCKDLRRRPAQRVVTAEGPPAPVTRFHDGPRDMVAIAPFPLPSAAAPESSAAAPQPSAAKPDWDSIPQAPWGVWSVPYQGTFHAVAGLPSSTQWSTSLHTRQTFWTPTLQRISRAAGIYEP